MSAEADALRAAMKGWGTDEKALINLVAVKTPKELQVIKAAYEKDFDRDLIKDIKSECSGDFEDALVDLLTDRAELDAKLVKKAIDGIGTSEDLLSEILCTRTAAEIKEISAAYKKLYDKEMISQVEDDVSGDFEKTLNLLITGTRLGKKVEDVETDVDALFNAGEGKWGTNEGVFIRTLCGADRKYCEALYHAYAKKHGKALDKVIRDEMGGGSAKALAYLVTPLEIIISEKLHDAMDGIGTNDSKLIRIIVTMRGRGLKQGGIRFLEEYKKTVAEYVKGECSGDYKRLLLKVLEHEEAY